MLYPLKRLKYDSLFCVADNVNSIYLKAFTTRSKHYVLNAILGHLFLLPSLYHLLLILNAVLNNTYLLS